ncbi:MAG TPA: o-succinylbenzoate synthase [Actinomycetota bacterium]|nr:o-succinylbenzoate synthase [Actinomycetota bacterium]
MRVREVELLTVALRLVRPFRTSFGEATDKECILVRVATDDAEGWGECVADREPDFSAEFNATVLEVCRSFLVPAVFRAGAIGGAADLDGVFAFVRGHPMAKAAVINAVLDAELRAAGTSLASFLGADRARVRCGVSVGITPTTADLLEQVDGYLADGYRRIKLKIAPGVDVERVAAVRERWPDVALSVDANAAYTLDDVEVFRRLDDLGLLMIEQPLHHDDLVDHATLQATIRTDVCLDESIKRPADASAAIALGACRLVNIKQGRVGGLLAARDVHDRCRDAGVPVWCGGMLETGVGRAANLALAALPNFTLPGDTSPSARYFAEDLTEPFVMAPDGTMGVPIGPGIGVAPIPRRLEAAVRAREVLTAG